MSETKHVSQKIKAKKEHLNKPDEAINVLTSSKMLAKKWMR